MKYLLAALLLCASASGAWAQVDFQSEATPEQRALALKIGKPLNQDLYASVLTPQQRGNAVRKATKFITPELPMLLPDGVYDFGAQEWVMPTSTPARGEVLVKAKNYRQARLQCASTWRAPLYVKDPADPTGKRNWINPDTGKPELVINPLTLLPVDRGASSCFVSGNCLTVDGVVLESTCPLNRQSAIIGPGFDSNKPRRLKLRNTQMNCGAWGPYLWHCDLDEIVFEENNEIHVANVGVAMGRSSGFNAQIVRVNGPKVIDGKSVPALTIYFEPERTTQGGSTTNPIDGGSLAMAVRGGQLYVAPGGLAIYGRGQAEGRGPNLVGIQDGFEGGSRHSVIEADDVLMQVTPGKGTKLTALFASQFVGNGESTTGRASVSGSLVIRKPESK